MLRHSAAAKITLAYAAFGAAWILGGDRLAAALSADFTAFAEIQTYKGLIYVAASAALVYWVAHFQMTARDRRVAELAVHQSTQLFKTAFHSNPVGMSIVKISDGSNLEVNDALTSLLGYSREEWEAMKAPLPWDNVSVFEEFKQRLLLHGRVDRYAASMVSKSGPLRLMELSAELITLRDEPCYLSVWVDATDRLRAEVAAIEGAMRYHAVVDNSPDGFCVLDKTGRILEVNDVYVEKSGYTREELLSMSLTDLQVSDSPADEARRRESVLSGETDLFETAHRTKDGSSWPVQVNTFYSLAHGGRFLVFLHDLSHRKKAQSALLESERRFSTVFRASPVAILIAKEQDGFVVDANDQMLSLIGYPREEFVGRKIADLNFWGDDDGGNRIGKIMMDHGRLQALEVKGRGKDGNEIDVLASIERISLGQEPHILAMFTDIADRKRTEARIQASMESTISAIAATVEMRDPYTAGHERRVGDIAVAIAREMGMEEGRLHGLRLASLVHDVGKINIPAELLSKPTRLSALEFEIIKTHAQSGFEILSGIDFPWPIAQIIHQHHERMDGSGYPRALMGKDILLEARILAVADTLEAMSSHRPYRVAIGVEGALEEVVRGRGTTLDADVVDACMRLFTEKGFTLTDKGVIHTIG